MVSPAAGDPMLETTIRSASPRGGFTLLEMMITITIIGLVSAIVIPSISSQSKAYDMVEQSRRIYSEIAKLRARAVAEQRDYQVQLTGGKTFTIRRDDGGGGWETVSTPETLGDTATATLNDAQSGTITFYPSGRVDAAGTIVIQDDVRENTVRVLASGMTRWETRRK